MSQKIEVTVKTIAISLSTWNINNCGITAMTKRKLRKMPLPVDSELMNGGAGIWTEISLIPLLSAQTNRDIMCFFKFATFHISHVCYPLSLVSS